MKGGAICKPLAYKEIALATIAKSTIKSGRIVKYFDVVDDRYNNSPTD